MEDENMTEWEANQILMYNDIDFSLFEGRIHCCYDGEYLKVSIKDGLSVSKLEIIMTHPNYLNVDFILNDEQIEEQIDFLFRRVRRYLLK